MCTQLGVTPLNFLIKAHPTLTYVSAHAEHITLQYHFINSKLQHHKIEMINAVYIYKIDKAQISQRYVIAKLINDVCTCEYRNVIKRISVSKV